MHASPRARPVSDIPGDALLASADQLARRWVLALIGSHPLAEIGEIPLEQLARDAPALCAHMIRALQADAELASLTGRGGGARAAGAPARRLVAIVGARNSVATVDAIESLRGVFWEVLLDRMTEPSARQLADVADRLAHVCAEMLAGALEAEAFVVPASSPDNDADAVSESESTSRAPALAGATEHHAIIVDERHSPERPLSWDESPPTSPGARAAEIEIRDERREEGPAAWIKSIGGQLERFERDRAPFAVLLVELCEIERLRREQLSKGLAGVLARVEGALAAVLGTRAGSLTRERSGRYWLLMPETDRAGAIALAGRLTQAVAACRGEDGAPLEVAIGTAVCPEDGLEASALAAHADVGLHADRSAIRASAGRRVPIDEPA
jgi:GGDEF domain-containing protein